MAAAEYYNNAPLNPSNLTPRAPTPTSQAIPYGADANAPYTYDPTHNQPMQYSKPPSAGSHLDVPGTNATPSLSTDLNANTSYEPFRPSSSHSTHSAPGHMEQGVVPTTVGPNGEAVEGERGLFSKSSNDGKSKSEKVLKFVVKQVEKKINKQSSGSGGQSQDQFNQYIQEHTGGQEYPYGGGEQGYGDFSQMGGSSDGHGISDFLNGGGGGDGGHGWMESLGLSSGGDWSGGDSSGLEAIFAG